MMAMDDELSGRRVFDDWRTMTVFVAGTALFILSAYFELLNDLLGWFTCVMLLTLCFWGRIRNSLAWVLLFAGITLYVVPYLSLVIVRYPVQIAWFALFCIVVEMLLRAEVKPAEASAPVLKTAGTGAASGIAALVVLATGVVFSNSGELLGVLLFVAWGCSLVAMERCVSTQASGLAKLLLLGGYSALLAIYVLFFWDGFGRIIISGLFFAPLLIILAHGVIRIPALAFAAFAFTLPFIGRVLRFGWGDGIAGIADDSGAAHILVTSEVWTSSFEVMNAGTLREQWILLMANWAPRALWPGKPLGIGSTFVDSYIGRGGFSEGHSTALGYFGEHLYLNRGIWLLSVIALTFTLIFLRRMIKRLSFPYAAPVIVFDVGLITLIWGGMAAFGARVWFPLIPMTILAMILNARDRRANRSVEPVGAAQLA